MSCDEGELQYVEVLYGGYNVGRLRCGGDVVGVAMCESCSLFGSGYQIQNS